VKFPVPVRVTDCGVLTEVQYGEPPKLNCVISGSWVMVTFVVAITGSQPPTDSVVYVTTYTPGVLAEGFTAPVTGSMLRPAGAENVPPRYVPVPAIVTGCPVLRLVQNGEPVYAILTVGGVVMVITTVLDTCGGQAPTAGVVYTTE